MLGRNAFIDRNLKYILPLPAVVFVFLLVIVPLCYMLFTGFTEWSLAAAAPPRFVGMENYFAILGDPHFRMAFVRTVIFTVGAVTTQTILGTIIAFIVYRTFKGHGLFKIILMLPLVAAPVAIGILFQFFFDPAAGVFNFVLYRFGLPQSGWITDARTVLPSLILVDVWQWTPIIALLVLAGLSSLPSEPFESAKVDGAGSVQIFFRITLPMISPILLAAIALRSVGALKTYDVIAAMTGGGPDHASQTLIMHAFERGFEYSAVDSAVGRAAATLVVLFLLMLFFSIWGIQARKRFEPRSGGK